MSSSSELDGREMSLSDAINAIVGTGMGASFLVWPELLGISNLKSSASITSVIGKQGCRPLRTDVPTTPLQLSLSGSATWISQALRFDIILLKQREISSHGTIFPVS
jgi:hypothetical protein